MNLENLVQPASWMNQEERQTATSLTAAFQQKFTARGLPEDPFLLIRLRELVLHLTLCRRLEQSVLGDGSELTPAAAAHLGKALERLRKALKDLEDTANRLDPSAPPSAPPRPSSHVQPTPPALSNLKSQISDLKSKDPIRPITPISPTPAPPALSNLKSRISDLKSPLPSPPESPTTADHLRKALQPALHVSRPVHLDQQQAVDEP